MQALATYILRGPLQAAGIIGLFGALAWVFPPFFLISCAALGLVNLKHNNRIGIQVMAGATALCAMVSYIKFGTPSLAFFTLLVIWLPTWSAASSLKKTNSQAVLLMVVMLMAILFTAGTRFLIGDIEAFWEGVLNKYPLNVEMFTSAAHKAEVIKSLSMIMNGFVAASFGLMITFSTLLARWWQSILFNPKGFGEEFRNIQLPSFVTISVLISVILVVVIKLPIPPYGLILDFMMAGIALLMIHGLSVVHFFVKERQLSKNWLVGLYFFLVIAAVYVFSLLAMLAVVDSFSDYRKLRSKSA